MTFHDELWQDLPIEVWTTNATHSGDKVMVRQCHRPVCHNLVSEKVHIVDTTLETEEPAALPIKIERTKYRIHCDACKQDFFLILERRFDKELLAEHDGTGYLRGFGPLRVYATDEEGEFLAEVGWI